MSQTTYDQVAELIAGPPINQFEETCLPPAKISLDILGFVVKTGWQNQCSSHVQNIHMSCEGGDLV